MATYQMEKKKYIKEYPDWNNCDFSNPCPIFCRIADHTIWGVFQGFAKLVWYFGEDYCVILSNSLPRLPYIDFFLMIHQR